MNTLGRQTLLWMIPVNLLLVAWVWFGRILFGVGGWFLLILLVTVVPVLLVALLLSTILAFTQGGRPRSLTRLQAVAQLVTWVGLFVLGAFMPDFGDTEDSQLSLLTQVFGYSDALYDLSFLISLAGGVVAIAGYALLLGALTIARRPTTAPA
ncbi:MAG TPA: hypothetical protein VD864_00580 [Nocardioides sp.]|nr:hypothetical protein [Nocardioides sp.]